MIQRKNKNAYKDIITSLCIFIKKEVTLFFNF